MFYPILLRILRRHVFFHLIIPLAIGILVEALYTHLWDDVAWTDVPAQLLSPHRIALYIGVIVAYIVVVGLLIRSDTNIGLRQTELKDLAVKLHGAKSLFAVAPTPLEEWFDPAAQAYFATLLAARLSSNPPFRYERVLLLPARDARIHLNSDYLDGYYAKCLINIHKRLGIDLYFLEWAEIAEILDDLTTADKIAIGYYPAYAAWWPHFLTRLRMFPVRRRRIRRIAGGVFENASGALSLFRFTKRENVVDVNVEPQERADAYIRFVEVIKKRLYDSAGTVLPKRDFTNYYDFTNF